MRHRGRRHRRPPRGRRRGGVLPGRDGGLGVRGGVPAEVTALGDEVNVTARIEACATGGLVLASRDLLERLDPRAATEHGLDPATLRYTTLADLPMARRDAPDVPVSPI